MEIRQLRYFVAVAEELHFTRASARLKISPPSLTEQIQRLEAELGVRLLHRTKRAVSLTDAGANFLKEARSTLLHAERAAVVARRSGRGEIGRVEIGYVSSASCTGILTRAVAEYRLIHPLVQLVIRKIETARQLEQIVEEKLDLGFLRPPDHYPPGIGSIVLARQPLILALPESHGLASRKIVATKELVGESFIAPSFEMEHGIFLRPEDRRTSSGFHHDCDDGCGWVRHRNRAEILRPNSDPRNRLPKSHAAGSTSGTVRGISARRAITRCHGLHRTPQSQSEENSGLMACQFFDWRSRRERRASAIISPPMPSTRFPRADRNDLADYNHLQLCLENLATSVLDSG
jgi:DNA-binding transcriptional LysR family regulator